MTVIIHGADFAATPTVTLAGGIVLSVLDVTSSTITCVVPDGLEPGIYAVAVENPDGQSSGWGATYAALAVEDPQHPTFESGYLVLFGIDGPQEDGDDDHVQVIFLEVPSLVAGPLYLRIYDPGIGGGFDEQNQFVYNTSVSYAVYGGTGAYSDPAARQATFASTADPGISSGSLLASATFASDGPEAGWLTIATLNPSDAELVGDRRLFKLAVVGGAGDDGNFYNVALSTDSATNVKPAGARMFAYSWTFSLNSPNLADRPPLYPYVPLGSAGGTIEQVNYDFDYVAGAGTMSLISPRWAVCTVPESGISREAGAPPSPASSSCPVGAGEDGATWKLTMEFQAQQTYNHGTLWMERGSESLPIFTRPTSSSAP